MGYHVHLFFTFIRFTDDDFAYLKSTRLTVLVIQLSEHFLERYNSAIVTLQH
jgi:hypothetical protein